MIELGRRCGGISVLPPGFAYDAHEFHIIITGLEDQLTRKLIVAFKQCHTHLIGGNTGAIAEPLQPIIVDEAAFLQRLQSLLDVLAGLRDVTQCDAETITLQITQFQCGVPKAKVTNVNVAQDARSMSNCLRTATLDAEALRCLGAFILGAAVVNLRGTQTVPERRRISYNLV